MITFGFISQRRVAQSDDQSFLLHVTIKRVSGVGQHDFSEEMFVMAIKTWKNYREAERALAGVWSCFLNSSLCFSLIFKVLKNEETFFNVADV